MELKQFIKEALLNIVEGVEEANKAHNRFKIIGVKHESGVDGTYAEFDVSVVVNEASSGEAGGKISVSLLSVASVGVGAKTDETNSQQNTHRLTFKVFVSENILDQK